MATSQNIDMMDYIIEDAVEAAKDAIPEEYKKQFNNGLAKALSKAVRLPENVQVLLVCWKNAKSDNHKDLCHFKEYLKEKFNYSAHVVRIYGSGHDLSNETFIAEIQKFGETSKEHTLSILYYTGHGYSNAGQRTVIGKRKELIIL